VELDLIINALGDGHDRKAFRCGEPVLDRYLQRYATQDIRRGLARVFVAASPETPSEIIGYYSLSAGSLVADELPETIRSRLPKYPVPVALLGRLAVDRRHQRQGIGGVLLADALKRAARASEAVAIHALVVDALDELAATYYGEFGFIPLPNHPLKLFLPLKAVESVP
jgi:GNAT superfamily N-acetyltransferase